MNSSAPTTYAFSAAMPFAKCPACEARGGPGFVPRFYQDPIPHLRWACGRCYFEIQTHVASDSLNATTPPFPNLPAVA